MDGELYESCVEPEYAHTPAGSGAYFPPLIALLHVTRGGADALELQLRRNWESYPASVKEQLVLEDVINVLCGSEGALYQVEPGTYEVRRSDIVDAKTDGALCMVAEEILELAVMQRRIQDFVQANERGFVALSLCEVLNVLLQELQSRIAQFDESQRKAGMGLQRFKLYVQPAISTFEVLVTLTGTARITGAPLINKLAAACQLFGTGDARRGLTNQLMKQAMDAYCSLMDPWVNFGELYDPCHEFFVVPKGATREECGIDWTRVPEVIKDVAPTVLETGNYVRILARSGAQTAPDPLPLQFTSLEELKGAVAAMHQAASDALMKHIVTGCGLMELLESAHRFFLLARADHVANLLADLDAHPLQGGVTLNFQEAVAQSSLRGDAHRHRYTLELEEGSAPVLSARSDGDVSRRARLCLRVEWPLRIFFSDAVLGRYQAVFRFLLQLKQTEHALARIWLTHMKWKRLPLAPSAQLRLNFTFVSIERMLFFCRNLAYQCTIEATERNFTLLLQAYESHLKGARAQQSFSFLVARHQQFVEQVAEQCLLEDEVAGPCVGRALSLCGVFATQVLEFLEQRETEEAAHRGSRAEEAARAARFTGELLHNQGYIAMVGTASQQFDEHLRALVGALEVAEARRQSSLLYRLKYNGFFT